MSQLRRARRKQQREQGKTMKKFVDLSKQQQDLENQFAATFREYGLDPYGKDSDAFQQALITHKIK
jgi:hypothetical protein